MGLHFSGCEDSSIIGCFAHYNGAVGISAGSSENNKHSKNIHVSHCRAYDNPGDYKNRTNHSGNGIVFGGVDHGVIEYCETTGNGWAQRQVSVNGPVGIWCCCGCTDIIMRYNISRYNRTQPGAIDGDGLDIDGEVQDSSMEYNYTYGNEGSGYLMCEYWGDSDNVPWENNRTAYNVSLDDDTRVPGYGSIKVANPDGVHFERMYVNDNLFVANTNTHCIYNADITEKTDTMVINNNVLVTDGIAGIQTPEHKHMDIYDNICIEDNDIRKAILEAAPLLVDPRDLDDQPVFDLLTERKCAEVLEKQGAKALFSAKKEEKTNPDEVLMVELQLYGPDLDGTDKRGDVSLYYDSIKPGISTKMTGNAEVHTPLTWWNDKVDKIVRVTYRLQEPSVKAYLFHNDTKGNEKRVWLSGNTSEYHTIEMPITVPDNCWFDEGQFMGVRTVGGQGSLYVHSIEFLELPKGPNKYEKPLPRSFGDYYKKLNDGTLFGGGWLEFTSETNGNTTLTVKYNAKDITGSIYARYQDNLYTEPIQNGEHTAIINVYAKQGYVDFGIDTDCNNSGGEINIISWKLD